MHCLVPRLWNENSDFTLLSVGFGYTSAPYRKLPRAAHMQVLHNHLSLLHKSQPQGQLALLADCGELGHSLWKAKAF